jgi:ribonuclease HII
MSEQRRGGNGKRRTRAEARRLAVLLSVERTFWERGLQRVAGIDEAGRGPLAGPVVAAAVVMPPGAAIAGIDDSKRLPRVRREELAVEIRRQALAIGIGAASAREVDRHNILRASHLAMRRAIARLGFQPDHLIGDGLPVTGLGEHTALVGGDARVHGVACASILAKVTRDRLMCRLAVRYPGFGWDSNMGYGTPEHIEALARLGPTPHHRLSYAPLQYTLEI